jgi:hypothetical protein
MFFMWLVMPTNVGNRLLSVVNEPTPLSHQHASETLS